MKSIFTVVVIVFILTNSGYGQDNYSKGIYYSLEEIQTNSPKSNGSLQVEKRTEGDIKMTGGNDYKLSSPDKSISKKTIKKEIYAYSTGDTLFLNCIHYLIQHWYAPVLRDGEFYVIRGGLSMDGPTQKEQLNNQAQFGYMFGAVGGAIQGAKLAMLRFIYVIDKTTNEINAVSIDYLKEMLSNKPELLEEYESEQDQTNQDTIVKYLTLINGNDANN